MTYSINSMAALTQLLAYIERAGYLQAERTKLESNTNSIISVYFYDSGVSGNYR